MQTRSSHSVLGKRPHHVDPKVVSTDMSIVSHQTMTPEQTPKLKRPRMSLTVVDGDSNKENIPPFRIDPFSTPAPSLPSLIISTPPPTPPLSLLPVYTRARALLRSTSPSPIAGREEERKSIFQFIATSWSNDSHTSLYISGTPGTGKTALVNNVLCLLEQSDQMSDLKVLFINCMALNSVDALYDRLHEELYRNTTYKSTEKDCKIKGKQAVEKALSALHHKCVLVLDELDHIACSCQILASIFTLSQHHPSTLRVIGIANTHTLASSLAQLSTREASSTLTLHFAAYSSQQLLQVLQARLSPLYNTPDCIEITGQAKKFLPTSTLTLLAKKIAAQTGDVRALLEVLRSAIDLAVAGSKATDADANPLSTPLLTVRPDHILTALKAYAPHTSGTRSSSSLMLSSISETMSKVRNLGLQAKLALLCMLLASKRMEVTLPVSWSASSTPTKSLQKRASFAASHRNAGLDVAQLHAYYSSVLTRGDTNIFTPVSRSEFSDLVGMLETVGLVSSSSACTATLSPTKTSRRTFGRTGSFGGVAKGTAAGQDIKLAEAIRTDEVLRGLGVVDDTFHGHVREEEVRNIWTRECARIARESRTKITSGMSVDKPFDEAFED